MVAQTVKNLHALQETRVPSLGREDPWRKEWLPTPAFLPGEFHGQRRLVGYSPGGFKESDMIEVTEVTHFCFLSSVMQQDVTSDMFSITFI